MSNKKCSLGLVIKKYRSVLATIMNDVASTLETNEIPFSSNSKSTEYIITGEYEKKDLKSLLSDSLNIPPSVIDIMLSVTSCRNRIYIRQNIE